MNSKIKAGVVLVSKFVLPEQRQFSGYIDYISRSEAVRTDYYNEYDVYAGDYMDNPNKTVNINLNEKKEIKQHNIGERPERISGLFTEKHDNLTMEQKNELQKQYKIAQGNKSPMWQNVISFDTNFLEETGVYDPETNILDEIKIKQLTRSSMSEKLKHEGMVSSAIWSAAIHYNKEHIHVHIAVAEPEPTRKKVTYKGNLEYRGKLKPKTLYKMKSAIVNDMLDRKHELNYINSIIRENMVAGLKSKDIQGAKVFAKDIKELKGKLPNNSHLWFYNKKELGHLKPAIDKIVDKYIDIYHKEDFIELKEKLERQEKLTKKAYGGNHYMDYTNNKLKDMHKRMGNALLTELRNQYKAQKHDVFIMNKSIKTNSYKTNYRKNNFNNMYALKKAMRKEWQNIKNLRIYESVVMKDDEYAPE